MPRDCFDCWDCDKPSRTRPRPKMKPRRMMESSDECSCSDCCGYNSDRCDCSDCEPRTRRRRATTSSKPKSSRGGGSRGCGDPSCTECGPKPKTSRRKSSRKSVGTSMDKSPAYD